MSAVIEAARKSSKRLSTANAIVAVLIYVMAWFLCIYGLVPVRDPFCVESEWVCERQLGLFNFYYSVIAAVMILSWTLIYRTLNAVSQQLILNVEILQALRGDPTVKNADAPPAEGDREGVQQVSEDLRSVRDDFVKALDKTDPELDEDDGTLCWVVKNPPGIVKSVSVDMVIYTYPTKQLEPMIVVSYLGDEAISFETLDVIADGKSHRLLSAASAEKQVDTLSGGKVSEVGVQEMGSAEEVTIMAILSTKNAKLKLSGRSRSIERKFTTAELDTLQTMITINQGLRKGFDPLDPR